MRNNATFNVAPDGRSITCLCCGRTSWHPRDVEELYCARCNFFHKDLLLMYVITHNTTDLPGKWPVRRFLIAPGRVIPHELLGAANDLDGARALVPRGCHRIDRAVDDDPVIVESWL